MKKVLVLGSGGREHALAAKFSQSPQVEQVFVVPGNPGMRDVATPVDLDPFDFNSLIHFVKEHKIDLTFVGPESLLCAGIVDAFQKENLLIFGPTKAAAQLEGSKVFSKSLMKKYNIPTASYESFSSFEDAKSYLLQQSFPIVLKADGLAAGKGVLIAQTLEEALQCLEEMMCLHRFDDAGSSVVIEEYLEGEEFSLLAFVHENLVIPMQIAQDHKKALDGDLGLNTGGMGAYTPVTHLPASVINQAIETIMQPMANALVQEKIPFSGILYGGCMVTKDGVKTIEYNVRFGDPEAEVLLPALNSDLYEVVTNTLDGIYTPLSWDKNFHCGVVLASKGYPLTYTKGSIIHNLDSCPSTVFHMGTAEDSGHLVTHGGRVLFVCDSSQTLKEACKKVYNSISKIDCDTLFYRKDIGNNGIR